MKQPQRDVEVLKQARRCWSCGYQYVYIRFRSGKESNIACPACGSVHYELGERERQ